MSIRCPTSCLPAGLPALMTLPCIRTDEVSSMTFVRFLGVAAVLSLVPAAHAADVTPAPANQPISYYKQIRPLFAQHCQGCHQPAKPLGGYVMTEHKNLLEKTDSDASGVVPGKPEQSKLLEQVLPQGGKAPAMPKGRDALGESDVALIRKWIAEGAKDDTPASARQVLVDADHPPVYALPPVLRALDYSPDGRLLAVSGYHEVLLHNPDGSGKPERLIGLSEHIESVAFSPDGRELAVTGGSPGRFGEVQIWDVEKHKLRLSVSVTHDTLYGVSWSPDGSKIALAADNTRH
jgi:mono/diheme cytochrome c family protein